MGRPGGTFIWLVALLLLGGVTGPAEARLSPLSNAEMAAVTGGFGVSVPAGQTVAIHWSADHRAYFDDDGAGAASTGAYLSFCGVRLTGALSIGSEATTMMGPFRSLIDGAPVAGLNLFLDDLTIEIAELAIDAIRVGQAPGLGSSFGAFSMQHFTLQITGKVQIYTH